jgi:hypothetical protein
MHDGPPTETNPIWVLKGEVDSGGVVGNGITMALWNMHNTTATLFITGREGTGNCGDAQLGPDHLNASIDDGIVMYDGEHTNN